MYPKSLKTGRHVNIASAPIAKITENHGSMTITNIITRELQVLGFCII